MRQTFRVYVPDLCLKDDSFEILDENAHIVKNVLRKKIDDQIVLMNGRGLVSQASIKKIQSNCIQLDILHKDQIEKEPYEIEICQSYIKPEKLSFAVQKCSEIGVNRFTVFSSIHSKSKVSEKLKKKLEKVAIESLRQSGQPYLMSIQLVNDLSILQNRFLSHEKMVLDELEEKNDLMSKMFGSNIEKLVLVIGPESGFTFEEREFLEHEKFCRVSIGRFVYRSETASIVSAAVAKNILDYKMKSIESGENEKN